MNDFEIPTIPEIREMERQAERKRYCPLCGNESYGVCAICWDEVRDEKQLDEIYERNES